MHHSILEGLVSFAAARAQSWCLWLALAGTLVVKGALDALAERNRRKTLEAALEKSPAATVVRLRHGRGGAAMEIRIGEDPQPPPTPTVAPHITHRCRVRRR